MIPEDSNCDLFSRLEFSLLDHLATHKKVENKIRRLKKKNNNEGSKLVSSSWPLEQRRALEAKQDERRLCQ